MSGSDKPKAPRRICYSAHYLPYSPWKKAFILSSGVPLMSFAAGTTVMFSATYQFFGFSLSLPQRNREVQP